MKRLSRLVVFVDTNPKHQRIAVLKDKNSLNQLEEDDTDVFQISLVERYQHRPTKIRSMCLAKFAAKYVVHYQRGEDEVSDAVPDANESRYMLSSQIVLTSTFGRMSKRRHQVQTLQQGS